MRPRADFNKKVKKLLAKSNDPVNLKNDFYVAKEDIARPNFG